MVKFIGVLCLAVLPAFLVVGCTLFDNGNEITPPTNGAYVAAFELSLQGNLGATERALVVRWLAYFLSENSETIEQQTQHLSDQELVVLALTENTMNSNLRVVVNGDTARLERFFLASPNEVFASLDTTFVFDQQSGQVTFANYQSVRNEIFFLTTFQADTGLQLSMESRFNGNTFVFSFTATS